MSISSSSDSTRRGVRRGSSFEDKVRSSEPEHDGSLSIPEFPNRWSRIRHAIREPVAEFLGTMILVTLIIASGCQANLTGSQNVTSAPKGDSTTGSLGAAVGICLGVWVSGSISGGHINPAVTISQAVFRGFPWRKVPVYILAQFFGAMFAALIVYGNYYLAIDLYEGGSGIRTVSGTAGLFGTYPASFVTDASAFFNEFLGTAILLIVILTATDKRTSSSNPTAKKASGAPSLVPFALFFALLGIAVAFGSQTGASLNPARDLGPRIASAMVGYGREVFTFRSQYWIWGGILAPISGALVGTLFYDALIYTGEDSILNKPVTSLLPR